MMAQHVLDGGPRASVQAEAGVDEVPARGAYPTFEQRPGGADLVVPLERDVTADHVEQQDAQRPNLCLLTVVALPTDPFWWAVHPGACGG